MQLQWLEKWNNSLTIHFKLQKQPARGVLRKRCSENMQQICWRTHMPKCDFNKVALQLYWNRTSAWVFSCKFAAYFENIFSKEHPWTAASEARNCMQFFCELKKFSLVENAQQHWGWNFFTPNHLQHFKQTWNFASLIAFWKSFVFFYNKIFPVGCPLYFT